MSTLQQVHYRMVQCPKCDYPLTGLPATHACPECGFAYQAGMFQIDGWNLAGLGMSKPTIIKGGAIVIILCAIAPAIGFGWSWLASLQLAMGAAVIVLGLLASVWYFDSRGRQHIVRYLITPEGIVTGERLLPWTTYSHIVLLQERGDAWRIHIYPSWWMLGRRPNVNFAFRGSFSQAEALLHELQRRINEARDRQHSS